MNQTIGVQAALQMKLERAILRAKCHMEPSVPCVWRSIPLVILLQGISTSAIAAPGDTFNPYVFASMTHDSNLLRINDAASSTNPADTVRQAGAGMDVDWKVARQQILLAASVNDNRFNRFSTLNYQGRNLRGAWNWQLDDHLNGDLGYTNNLTIGSFDNQQTIVRNLRTQEQSFFDGLWSFHPSWKVGVGASKNKLTFPDITQRILDRDDDVWETSLQYLSSANNKVGIKLRETNGHYPNQAVDFVNMLDSGYQQREVLATMDWNDGGHNLFGGYAGTVQRKHDHFSRRDFNDINARGTYGWLPTGNIRLDASAWHEVWAYDDLTTSYSRNLGISLEPRWMPYSTITVSGRIQRERRDFLGDPGILVLTTVRQDTALMRDLAVSYQPAPNYTFRGSVGDQRRDSNQSQFSFYSKMVSISARLEM